MMKMKTAILVLFFFTSHLYGQGNSVRLDLRFLTGSGSGFYSPNETISHSLFLEENYGNIVAFQADIIFPDGVNYMENTLLKGANSSLSSEHTITSRIISSRTLRIIIYSSSQTSFNGSNKSLFEFSTKLGTIPGQYNLQITNVVMVSSNGSSVSVTELLIPTITIVTPDIDSDQSNISFGSIPLGNSSERSVIIYNRGNSALTVSNISSSNNNYEIIGEKSFTIAANSPLSKTIKFNSIVKGNINSIISIYSDDPDEPIYKINLSAIAFAVNEIHIVNVVGRSGYEVEVPITINNMENFIGFQLDIVFPTALSYVNNSAALSSRKLSSHNLLANIVSAGRVRLISYSTPNDTFTGKNGEIATIKFLINGTTGSYGLNVENAIISDANAINIISASYGGYVNISSPDISANVNIDLGEIATPDTIKTSFSISNSGQDTLIIPSFTFTNTSFWTNSSFPIKVSPGSSKTCNLFFHNISKGNYSSILRIRSNDPDEDPFNITITAISFAPNYLKVENAEAAPGDTARIYLSLDNFESAVALQTDLEFPSGFSFVNNSAKVVSARKQDHVVTTSLLTSTKIRVIVYSSSSSSFLGSNGSLIELKFITGSGTGTAALTLSNGIISNNSSQNILKGVSAGSFSYLESNQVKVSAKVLLQGAFSGSEMATNLNSGNYIPLNSNNAYSSTSYSYQAKVISSLPNTSIVDWVLIELRTSIDATTKVATEVGFVLKNGLLVSSDGVTSITISSINHGNYYLVIRHRNHLAIMSANTIPFSSTTPLYDFTNSQSKAYGLNPMKELVNNIYGLYSGDGNSSGSISITDRNSSWRPLNGQIGYHNADFNLSGGVNITDRNSHWRGNNGKVSQVQ